MNRLNDTELDIVKSAESIYSHFGYDIKVQKAILDGSMGKYGVTFKLTTQVIGSWIYKSREKKRPIERI